jgi:hypothetical protein
MTDMMKPDNEALNLIVELAKESEIADPIDWGKLALTEEQAYIMMGTYVIDMELDDLTSRAIIVKLLVENFVLNLKLLANSQGK